MAGPRKNPLWETAAIFAALFSLWPALLRYWAERSSAVSYEDLPLAETIDWASPFWSILMYAALVVMLIVAVRRVRRVRKGPQRDDDADFTVGNGPIDPYASMHRGKQHRR